MNDVQKLEEVESWGAVTYFVRMVAKPGQAEAVQELLLTNPRRIE